VPSKRSNTELRIRGGTAYSVGHGWAAGADRDPVASISQTWWALARQVGGDFSTLGPVMAAMMREVADNVSVVRLTGTAHFVAEENLVAMAEVLLSFPSA
jgi:hypothetical protein